MNYKILAATFLISSPLVAMSARVLVVGGTSGYVLAKTVQHFLKQVPIVSIEPESDILEKSYDIWGYSPLMRAVDQKNYKKVLYFIEQNEDVNAPNKFGRTPLMLAIVKGDQTAYNLLVDRGLDLDAQDQGGKTALMWAFETNNLEMAIDLIRRGVNLKLRDCNNKSTAEYLNESCLMNKRLHVGLANDLLKRGLDLSDEPGISDEVFKFCSEKS